MVRKTRGARDLERLARGLRTLDEIERRGVDACLVDFLVAEAISVLCSRIRQRTNRVRAVLRSVRNRKPDRALGPRNLSCLPRGAR